MCTWEDENNQPTKNIIYDAVSLSFDAYYLERLPIETLRDMGSVISQCKKLKSIIMTRFYTNFSDVSNNLLAALFQAEGPYNIPLEDFVLCKFSINLREFQTMLPFLKSRGELDCLSLNDCEIGDDVAGAIGEVLDHTRIENINLRGNEISAKGLSNLLSGINSIHLKSLDLEDNLIGQAEVEEIARFLSKEDVTLEWIAIGKCPFILDQYFDPDWMEVLLRSLKRNTSLKRLHVIGDINKEYHSVEGVKQVSIAAMELICNVSCFDALRESNHTIEFTCTRFYPEDPTLLKALIINAKHDISTTQKLRYKMRWIYFQQNFDVNPFYLMKLVWIPNVMELMTISVDCSEKIADDQLRDVTVVLSKEGNLSGMYHFIRQWDLSELFSFRCQKRP